MLSDTVLTHYCSEGFEFLLRVFNTPNYLEDLTGLSKLYAETLDDHIWELSDDECAIGCTTDLCVCVCVCVSVCVCVCVCAYMRACV